ncbi:hypothetical protein [Sphingomonas turrisvirgatae]|uniref:Uncharacterized protein n=1 Tax=Sphingomonas turrisvirgatae TaxID=1888892 RepID=A0A1E3LTE1_9SPHN|nr:hypothetical protein [Sphingomonas turrisvirgatae]ODP37028.1 hypothetical protein BFL28_19105 [Sphingomonas turrisvirgatae]
MSQFEFFMTFYSLLVGLAVAELLLGFMNLMRHRQRPRLGLLTPLLGAVVFLQLMALFIDAWTSMRTVQISMLGLAVPTLIGVATFAASVLVVPRDVEEWPDLDAYFFRNRRIVLGLLVAVNLLILFHESAKVRPDQLIAYALVNLTGFALLGGAMALRHRFAVALSLAALICLFINAYSNTRFSLMRLFSYLTG